MSQKEQQRHEDTVRALQLEQQQQQRYRKALKQVRWSLLQKRKERALVKRANTSDVPTFLEVAPAHTQPCIHSQNWARPPRHCYSAQFFCS
jgi:type II secretory pathway pseudopilin PulG